MVFIYCRLLQIFTLPTFIALPYYLSPSYFFLFFPKSLASLAFFLIFYLLVVVAYLIWLLLPFYWCACQCLVYFVCITVTRLCVRALIHCCRKRCFLLLTSRVANLLGHKIFFSSHKIMATRATRFNSIASILPLLQRNFTSLGVQLLVAATALPIVLISIIFILICHGYVRENFKFHIHMGFSFILFLFSLVFLLCCYQT